MRSIALFAPVLALAACAGAQTEFSTAGLGPVPGAVECAADAIEDEGFVVTQRDEAGILHARRGDDWLEVNVVPDGTQRYVINVRTADTDVARDAAEDITTECGA